MATSKKRKVLPKDTKSKEESLLREILGEDLNDPPRAIKISNPRRVEASRQLLREQLEEILTSLSPREGRVLQLRYGLKDGKSHTQEEVGKKFGVTAERIRQIEVKALRKLRHPSRSRKLQDYVWEETPEQEYVGIGVFGGRLRLISLNKDGQYRFIDGTEKPHNILYVASVEALAMNEAIEELEFLLNNPRAKEKDYQDFFERNPKLILNDEYKKAHAHITLAGEESPLIPDFLLEPWDQNALVDILDLKLPTTNIFVLKKSRMRYSAAVMEACAQLREYNQYFDDKENRQRIYREYGLLAFKPKMIVIIGRRGDVDPIAVRKIQSDVPQLVLRTYDDILERAKVRLQST